MSNNYRHGKEFERKVLESYGVDPSLVEPNSVFDIPLGITTASSDPVSVKSCKSRGLTARVYLSDATRIWSWCDSLRMVIGLWTQEAAQKKFHTVWELDISLDEIARTKLFGTVTLREVADLHQGLLDRKDLSAPATRAWAYAQRSVLAPRLGVIHLDPKIDSARQRRLQCSALLNDLANSARAAQCFSEGSSYRGIALPLWVQSTPRERKVKTPPTGSGSSTPSS